MPPHGHSHLIFIDAVVSSTEHGGVILAGTVMSSLTRGLREFNHRACLQDQPGGWLGLIFLAISARFVVVELSAIDDSCYVCQICSPFWSVD